MLETTNVALCAAVKAFELSDVGSFVEGELRSAFLAGALVAGGQLWRRHSAGLRAVSQCRLKPRSIKARIRKKQSTY